MRSAWLCRFKLSRDRPGWHSTRNSQIEIEEKDQPMDLSFPDPEPMRFPGSLISASDVSFRYPGAAHNIVEHLNITIHPGSRGGLLGLNGRGKSTIMKILTGSLKPTRGVVERHPRLRLGYYAQHSVEELSGPDVAASPALQYFRLKLKSSFDIDVNEGMARSFLGSFGLHGKKATNPLGTLSGGQKVPCSYLSTSLFSFSDVWCENRFGLRSHSLCIPRQIFSSWMKSQRILILTRSLLSFAHSDTSREPCSLLVTTVT